MSLSRYKGEGLLENSGFERTYAKLKLDQKVSKKLRAGANVSYTNALITGLSTSTSALDPDTGETGNSSAQFNILSNIIQGRPTGGLFISNNDLVNSQVDFDPEENIQRVNPLASARSQEREDERRNFTIQWIFRL